MKAFLYAADTVLPRQILDEEELINVKLASCIKHCKTQEELDAYVNKRKVMDEEKGVEVEVDDLKFGQYVSGLRVMSGNKGYASVFYYQKQELEEYMEKTGGSIAGFLGSVYTDWLYLDFDPKEFGPEQLAKTMKPFLNWLINNKFPHYLFYSGGSGFHVYVPKAILDYPEEVEGKANILCKVFLRKLLKLFPDLKAVSDEGVYSVSTIFRMPFTINQKTGKLKTILYWDKDNEKYIRMENDNERFRSVLADIINPDHSSIKPVLKIEKSDIQIAPQRNISFDTRSKGWTPKHERPCIYALMNKDVGKGEGRHMFAKIIMGWAIHQKGLPDELAYGVLDGWNKRLSEPLAPKEIENVWKYKETVNYKPCNQTCMHDMCIKNSKCPDWNEVESGVKPRTMADVHKKMMERRANGSPSFNLNTIFPALDLEVTPSEGHITIFTAGSKVG